MSRRNSNGKGPKLDLKLNLSPTTMSRRHHEPAEESPPSSCVSSEDSAASRRYSSSPESAAPPMVLVGCPRCLMYVMLAKHDPKCPKCKSTVLLDVFNDHNNNKN